MSEHRCRELPIEPLLERLEARYGPNQGTWANVLGVHREVIVKQLRAGVLRLDVAERYAATAGYHPLEIWADYHMIVTRDR